MDDAMAKASTTAGARNSKRVNPTQLRAARILKGNAKFDDKFFPNHDELSEVIGQLRSMGCVIAFTTGVWDLFHIGHAKYIRAGKEAARQLYPDAEHVIMVVGVDTDALTKQRKGPKRPIVPEAERYEILCELGTVDILVPQYEANQLYTLIDHDVRVISESTKDLPSDHDTIRAQCEHLVNLPPQAETSTTARIRILAIDGGIETLEKVSTKLLQAIEEARNELNGKQ
ncbi:MAG: FAD synthetase [Parcubacteria bacterium C7867-001]|nr:MAG: FAD synthetase [Parcubacteria bacterium C7867-001]